MKEPELTQEDKADAARLKSFVERSGLTQEQIRAELGYTQGMIGHFVNGRRKIHLDAAIDFSNFLKVPVGEFSPSSQMRINSAYSTPNSGNLASIITLLQKMDGADLALATDLLQSVIRRKISDIKVDN